MSTPAASHTHSPDAAPEAPVSSRTFAVTFTAILVLAVVAMAIVFWRGVSNQDTITTLEADANDRYGVNIEIISLNSDGIAEAQINGQTYTCEVATATAGMNCDGLGEPSLDNVRNAQKR